MKNEERKFKFLLCVNLIILSINIVGTYYLLKNGWAHFFEYKSFPILLICFITYIYVSSNLIKLFKSQTELINNTKQ